MAALSLFFILAACSSEPRIDTSSDAALKKSIAKVRAALLEERKKDFDEAITALAVSNISFDDMMAGSVGKANADARIKEALHGKTGPEVIASAEPIIRENAERKEKAQATRKELEELRKKMEKMKAAR